MIFRLFCNFVFRLWLWINIWLGVDRRIFSCGGLLCCCVWFCLGLLLSLVICLWIVVEVFRCCILIGVMVLGKYFGIEIFVLLIVIDLVIRVELVGEVKGLVILMLVLILVVIKLGLI